MKNIQIRNYFINMENVPCPLTEELIGNGYVQKYGGYKKYARQRGINNPTQFWHLIYSWSKRRNDDAPFNKRIQCGELIFWMAEVSKAVDTDTLEELKNIISNDYLHDRRNGNRKIQAVCFDKIINIVEGSDIS